MESLITRGGRIFFRLLTLLVLSGTFWTNLLGHTLYADVGS
jgi:hypothetical protein